MLAVLHGTQSRLRTRLVQSCPPLVQQRWLCNELVRSFVALHRGPCLQLCVRRVEVCKPLGEQVPLAAWTALTRLGEAEDLCPVC